MRRSVLTFLYIIVVALSSFAQPKTIRVPQDQATIQGAINAAVNGDTVLVADGTYSVNLLVTKKIVLGSLYILDHDTSHISKTILDGGTPRHPDSSSVILVTTGTDSTTVISGFTIRNGHGTKITLGSDVWWQGGGIHMTAGGVTIAHNRIVNNTIQKTDQAIGGGIVIVPMDGPISYWIVEHNTVSNNTVSTSVAGGAFGGGVVLNEDGRFRFNTVTNNTSVGANASAGGVCITGFAPYGTATIDFSNNRILENSSGLGAAIVCWVDPVDFAARPVVRFVNNIISSNLSPGGSAFVMVSGDYTLINNTIINNVAGTGNEAIRLVATRGALSFRLMNNLVWNPGSPIEFNNGGLATGSYNLVRGGFAGTGNISSDPLFTAGLPDSANSLGWFRFNSPAANAGAVSATVGGVLLTAPTTDYYGHTRFGSAPDIGAFEDGPWSAAEDLEPTVPADFALEQNYPNPFNPETVIGYRVAGTGGWVKLAVHDLLGREVAVLVDGEKAAGYYEAVFSRQYGVERLPSGVYFYRMSVRTADGQKYEATKRMVMIK